MRKVEVKQYENFKSTVRNTAQNLKICSLSMSATKGLSAVKTVVQHGEQDIRTQVRLKKMALCHPKMLSGQRFPTEQTVRFYKRGSRNGPTHLHAQSTQWG